MHAVFVAEGPSESIQFHLDESIPVECNLNAQAKWTYLKSVSTYFVYGVIVFVAAVVFFFSGRKH